MALGEEAGEKSFALATSAAQLSSEAFGVKFAYFRIYEYKHEGQKPSSLSNSEKILNDLPHISDIKQYLVMYDAEYLTP